MVNSLGRSWYLYRSTVIGAIGYERQKKSMLKEFRLRDPFNTYFFDEGISIASLFYVHKSHTWPRAIELRVIMYIISLNNE